MNSSYLFVLNNAKIFSDNWDINPNSSLISLYSINKMVGLFIISLYYHQLDITGFDERLSADWGERMTKTLELYNRKEKNEKAKQN